MMISSMNPKPLVKTIGMLGRQVALLLVALAWLGPQAGLSDEHLPAPAQALVEIEAGDDVEPENITQLRATLASAIEHFRQNFSKPVAPIRVRAGRASEALRTGYSYKEGILHFPSLKQVRDQGLASADVIRHEVFHLLACQSYPSVCPEDLAARPELVSLHEALADFFAYTMEPDSTFGESYFRDREYMRVYRTDLRLSLIEGPHAQGNVIAGYLIEDKTALDGIRSFLKNGNLTWFGLAEVSSGLQKNFTEDLSFEIIDELVGDSYPPSRLRRYRLKTGLPLQLKFRPNSAVTNAYPGLRIRWLTEGGEPPTHFEFTEKETLQYEVLVKPGAKSEKVIAYFVHGDKVIGGRSFYFGSSMN